MSHSQQLRQIVSALRSTEMTAMQCRILEQSIVLKPSFDAWEATKNKKTTSPKVWAWTTAFSQLFVSISARLRENGQPGSQPLGAISKPAN